MRRIMTTTLALFTFYSSQLMAHPHEANAISPHSAFHVMVDKGGSLLLIFVIGLIMFKLIKYFNEIDTSNR